MEQNNNTVSNDEPAEQNLLIISAKLTDEERNALLWVCYDKGKESYKKGDKISIYSMILGAFALVCFAIGGYFIGKYGFDFLFALLMLVYLAVAEVCMIKPVHYEFMRLWWKIGFSSRMVLKKDMAKVRIGEKSIGVTTAKGKIRVDYGNMWDIYETSDAYVFHYDDSNIIPLSKKAVEDAAGSMSNDERRAFFSELIKLKAGSGE